MRRRAWLVLSVVAFVLSGCGGDDASPVLPPGRAIETVRTLTPTTHLFADDAHARLDVIVDRRLIDPERVRVSSDFEPYETVGGVVRSRADLGEYTRLRFDYTLRCLTADCIPVRLESILGEQEGGRGERRTFRFPPSQVRYDDPTGDLPSILRSVSWPALTSVSRLSEAQADAEFPFRLSPTPLPALSYRVPPPTFALGALAGGLALVLFPSLAALRWWRRRRPVPAEAPTAELSPLERARALLVWSSEQDSPERRRALSNYAAELSLAEGDGAAGDALALAWSRPAPSSEAVLSLAAPREDDP